MRAVAQRVVSARVEVAGESVGEIGPGLLVYLGAGRGDGLREAEWMAGKLAGLRIFEDDAGKMNHSILDTQGAALIVSQFTLYGDVRSGRRPGFDGAAPPEQAEPLYAALCEALERRGVRVATGRFRAEMQVHAQVDGPVTILVDSERKF